MAKRKTLHPNPIDVHVGGRIRLRRTLLGLSQEKLSSTLGITFQQVQKYENGTNRVGASRLYQISRALGVPVSFFYDGFEQGGTPASAVAENTRSDELQRHFESRETVELVKAYYSIHDSNVRRKVLEMIKSLKELS